MRKIIILMFSNINLFGAFLILGTTLFSCSLNNNTNKDLPYIELDNGEIIKENGLKYFYYKGEPFTGYVVFLYYSNQTVKRLVKVKNGLPTGEQSEHGGTKTIGQITTVNGMLYRLPSINEEVKIDKQLVYFKNSEQIMVERAGYLKKNQSGEPEFVRDGVCTYYNKDGSVSETKTYAEDILMD
jgi:antitoxin component YwqK of YwqJK toxin-antitoxin module